jgi:hypothetical protein
MESSTFSDDYLTKLRVMIRENAAQSAMFAEMLQEFVEDYLQQLEAKMQGVDTASAEAQKFLESYERLLADFENFAGEISFADPLELKAMWENRAYWEQRFAELPPIPKQQKLKALPLEEPTQKTEGAEPAPEAPLRKARSATMHSAHSSARHSSRPSQVSGPPPSRASAPSLRTIRQQEYEAAPSRPVHQTRRMPDTRGPPVMHGFGIPGSLAAVAA